MPWAWSSARGCAWVLAGLTPLAWAQAAVPNVRPDTPTFVELALNDKPDFVPVVLASMSLLSRLEVSTPARATTQPLPLRLQGDAHSGQVVRIEQNGLVFFEQQLPNGPFEMDVLPPFNLSTPVRLQLQSPNLPDENLDLPLAVSTCAHCLHIVDTVLCRVGLRL